MINQRDAIALAIMCVGSFLIETTLGLVLLPFIPFPLMGGLLSGFFDAILIFLAIYLVPRRGAPLLFAVFLLTLSTVTPSFGPIGLYKISIGLGLGLTIEAWLLLMGRSILAYVAGTAIAFGLSIPMTYFAWVSFGIPGADLVRPIMFWLILAYTVLGALGASTGAWIYKTRLSRHATIVRLREGSTV
jgi:hypothetical protein